MEGSVKMGYRSDVRIMTSKKGFKLLNKYVKDRISKCENKDYSFRFARIGENYDDYEEDYYDSTKEEEQDLLYPCITRYFLDDMIEQEMDRYKNIEDKEL